MTDETRPRGAPRAPRLATAAALMAVALSLIAGWFSYGAALRWGVENLGARGEKLLDLAAAGLESDLARFASLPSALASFGEIQSFAPERDAAALNRLLERVAEESGARDIYILDGAGVAVASSNWRKERSFLGRNYAFRPYFTEALERGESAYHALGTASNERGFYFSHSFESAADARRYVLTVKMDAARVEAAWQSADAILLVDQNKVAFLASEPGLRLASVRPLGPERLNALAESRQYAGATIAALPAMTPSMVGRWTTLRLDAPAWRSRGFTAAEVAMLTRPLMVAGRGSFISGLGDFELRAMLDMAEPRRQALTIAALATMTTLMAAGGAMVLAARRRAAGAARRREAEAKQELERRVAERTSALSEANKRLERAAAARRDADAALRQAEADLAQSRRLAALGRLAADFSHEVNQPLAALRAYSENGGAFLEAGRTDAAAENFGRITAMADRIGRIIANLKTFARGQAPPPRPVRVSDALFDALELAEPRLARLGARVTTEGDALSAVAMMGRVRLQQVFSNLIENALDAVASQERREIMVTALSGPDDCVRIAVADSGRGLDPDLLERAFDPFVTTKGLETGPGLGLGLSIVYGMVTAAGGRISAANRPGGGAVFTVQLKRAAADETPADETPADETPADDAPGLAARAPADAAAS